MFFNIQNFEKLLGIFFITLNFFIKNDPNVDDEVLSILDNYELVINSGLLTFTPSIFVPSTLESPDTSIVDSQLWTVKN